MKKLYYFNLLQYRPYASRQVVVNAESFVEAHDMCSAQYPDWDILSFKVETY